MTSTTIRFWSLSNVQLLYLRVAFVSCNVDTTVFIKTNGVFVLNLILADLPTLYLMIGEKNKVAFSWHRTHASCTGVRNEKLEYCFKRIPFWTKILKFKWAWGIYFPWQTRNRKWPWLWRTYICVGTGLKLILWFRLIHFLENHYVLSIKRFIVLMRYQRKYARSSDVFLYVGWTEPKVTPRMT